MFSVVPVPARLARGIDPVRAGRMVAWLPLVGALLAVVGMGPALVVWRGAEHGSPLLAAVLWVTSMAVLTRGLHLDGLADLADGLGSGRAADEASTIMHRSDIGAFGVAAIVLDAVVQVAAVSALLQASSRPIGVLAVTTAAVIGRLAVVWAAGHRVPVAPGSSLGALVGASQGPGRQVTVTVLAGVAVAVAAATGGVTGRWAPWWAGAVLAAAAVTAGLCRHVCRRLGGVSGDVFGALVELGTTVTLVVLAGGLTWR
jgi:adenosylcobinamide-GDP ribazoletransferase